MFVFNARLGHACNSSSTHSIIMLDDIRRDDNATPDHWEEGPFFGWDEFQLLTAQDKLAYIGFIINHTGQQLGMLPEEIADYGRSIGVDTQASAGIDHQSVFTLPLGFNGRSFNTKFMEELVAFMSREDVVVLGGNDNDYGDDDKPSDHFAFHGGEIVRHDSDGTQQWWTLFSKASGNKLRMTFDAPLRSQQNQAIRPRFNNVPELVDMKITGYCPFAADCGWCYMDSDAEGSHADINHICGYLTDLASLGVFEIALGGGEPTMHPDFLEILAHGTEAGMNMNFTTKNFAYFTLKNKEEWRRSVASTSRAIAFSVNNRKDFERFVKMIESRPFEGMAQRPQMTLQCIPAVCPTALFEEMTRWCSDNMIRMTMLGFKRVGRGEGYKEPRNVAWLDTLTRLHEAGEIRSWWLNGQVAVDTVMADECTARFDAMGVDPTWYHVEEGAFSCYIDATTNKLGASSFTGDEAMLDLPWYSSPESTKELYQQMQHQLGLR